LIKAVENCGEFPDFYAYVADDINKRADYVISALAKLGISCNKREGTYYILIDVSPLALCI
jgi:aspartate/methionine/tyrosine aminotransferase